MRSLILGSLLLWSVSSACAQQWPTFRADNARSGIATESLDCTRLELDWEWQSPAPPLPAWDGPARWDAFAGLRDLPAMRQYDACFHPVSDGKSVFFGSSSQDCLFSVDLETGQVNWRFFSNGPIRLAPTLYGNKVLFGCDDGYAYCVDRDNGELIWKFSPSREAALASRLVINNDRLISRFPIRTGITVRDGLAYFAASFLPWQDSFLCAVDVETGAMDDMKSTFVAQHKNATLEGSLLVANDRLIVPQGRVAPLIFDRNNGKNLGALPGGGGVTVVLTEQGEIVRTEGGSAARAGQVGVFQGKERVASFPRGRAIVVDQDRFYVIDGQKLFAAGRADNQLLWHREVDGPLELVKTGECIIVGGTDHVSAFRAETGELVWSAPVSGRVFGLAVAGAKLIASTDTGALVSFSPTSPDSWQPPDVVSAVNDALGPAPPVEPVEHSGLLHRWVFHRQAMDVGDGQMPNQRSLTKLQVVDQQDRVNLPLSGTANVLSFETSDRLEAIELKDKSHFPIAAEAAEKLPTESITAEAWVRVDKKKTWGGIVGCILDNGSTEFGWLLGFRDDKFCLAIAGEGGGLTYMTADEAFQTGAWYHVVGTYDGNQMKIFVNGRLAGTGESEKGPIEYSPEKYFTVGAYRDTNELYGLDGALHEVRIYDKALTTAEIEKHFQVSQQEFPEPVELVAASAESVSTDAMAWGPVARYVRPGTIEFRYGTTRACMSVVELQIDGETVRHSKLGMHREHVIQVDGLPHRRIIPYEIRDTDSEDSQQIYQYVIDTHFDWSSNTSEPKPNWTSELVSNSPNPRGLALVIGEELASQAKELAAGSEFSVVLVVNDDDAADRVRQQWMNDEKVIYGSRLSVQPMQLDQLPGAFANVVISKDTDAWTRRLVRPDGGILHNGSAVTWQRDPIEGSGVWSHMYGTADNSAFGGEELSNVSTRQDLEVQWIGRPGPRYQTDRQNRKPSPLAAGGRVFLQGQQRLIGLDSYSGSVLWSLETPTVMRWNVPHDCSNWCADEDGVFVAAENRAWFLDGRSGQIARTYDLPEENRTNSLAWGYIGRSRDYLIGTAVESSAIYTNWWGSTAWFDSTAGPDTHLVAGDTLFALDKETAELKWKHDGLVLHPTITILGDNIYFVQDNTPAHIDAKTRRIALDKEEQYDLTCLSLETGEQVWQRRLPSFAGRVAVLYLAAGGKDDEQRLVLVASESSKQHFSVQTFDPASGQPGWSREVAWESNHHGKHISRPAIQGELVYIRPEVLNMETGEMIKRGFPSGHGCASYALSTVGMFGRLGEITWWNPRNEKVNRFTRLRTDCWISVVPAQGMLIAAEGGGGCSCGSWLETSLGFLPRSVDDSLPESQQENEK